MEKSQMSGCESACIDDIMIMVAEEEERVTLYSTRGESRIFAHTINRTLVIILLQLSFQ